MLKHFNTYVVFIMQCVMVILFYSCNKDKYITKQYWENFTTEDGLVNGIINSVAIDNKGNKWFGSKNGVSVFNDTIWRSYNISNGLGDNYVQSIISDPQGKILIATHAGISVFDGLIWSHINTGNSEIPGDTISSIVFDKQQNLWVAVAGKGITKFDGNTWTTYSTKDGLASNYIISIAIDDFGNFWFGSFSSVTKFDGTNWVSYSTAENSKLRLIQKIGVDKKGALWVGTVDDLLIYNGATWKSYNLSMFDIAFDDSNTKWICGNDLASFDDQNWHHFSYPNSEAYYYSIVIDKYGTKWIGSDQGVFKFYEVKIPQ